MPEETPAQETGAQEAGAQETGAQEATARLPTSPEALLARLAELGIEARTFTHPPVHTVEQAKALRGDIEGAHIKNLFLRNKKGAMWLVTCLEDREIDLRRWAGRWAPGASPSAARLA